MIDTGSKLIIDMVNVKVHQVNKDETLTIRCMCDVPLDELLDYVVSMTYFGNVTTETCSNGDFEIVDIIVEK